MNLFERVGKFVRRWNPAPDDDFWYNFPSSPAKAGVNVNEFTALNYSAVYNAITLYANAIGFLPLHLIREKKSGTKEKITNHPAIYCLSGMANELMPGMTLRELHGAHVPSWGNAYAEIVWGNDYEITELWPLPPNKVRIDRPTRGQIFYKVSDGHTERTVIRPNMLHIPGLGFDGLRGYSVITKARESIGLGLATEEFGATYFGNGTHPSVVVTHPNQLGEDAHRNLKKDLIDKYSGLGKAHRLLLLEEGMQIEKIGIPPEDSQFLETRQFQIPEIARWFNLPPHKLKDLTRSTFSNIEHQSIEYVVDSIVPYCTRFEENYKYQLLSEAEIKKGFYFKFSIEGLLRGDSASRAQFYKELFMVGAMSQNEIRAKEDLNPIDGGDKYFVPLNMIPSDQAGQVPTEPVAPVIDETKSLPLEQRSPADSIKGRDRLVSRYRPLIKDAAQRVINKETIAVKRAAEKYLTKRSVGEFDAWVEKFYKTFPEYIRMNIGAVLLQFGDAIAEAAGREIGEEITEIPEELQAELNGYVEDYGKRHIGSSTGQIAQLTREATEKPDEVIAERMDAWHEKRSDKIANNETVRASNMVAQAVFFTAGLLSVWRIRGESTCPYCTSLNGKRIARGGSFAKDGDFIKIKGHQWMPIKGLKRHPPLHQGCDCFLTAV